MFDKQIMKSQRLTKYNSAILNSYATECFRDVADMDYISSRVLFRSRCVEQAFWSAQQCLEKYFKAILAYNKVKKSKGSHDLSELYAEIRSIRISGIEFEFPEAMDEWIEYFNWNGNTDARYRQSSVLSPWSCNDLLNLDCAVFYLRRYCRVLDAVPDSLKDKANEIHMSQMRRLSLSSIEDNWKRALLMGGKLETILKSSSRRDAERSALIWKNQMFGNGNRRPKVATYPDYLYATNPPLTRDPSRLDIIEKYVHVPRRLRKIRR